MFRKVFWGSLVLILIGAGLNLAATLAQAGPRGGVHIGGFHGGGFHTGGFHGGAHLGGFRSPGYHPGAFHTRVPFNAHVHHYHYPLYNHGYYRTWPNNGYYGLWPYYSYSYPLYPYYSDLAYGYSYGPVAAGYGGWPELGYLQQLGSASGATVAYATLPQGAPAEINMTLPTGATLWAQGKQIPGRGSTRQFHSPTLAAGHRYAYDFRATWKKNGHTVTQTQTVIVTPGAHLKVHFPVEPARTHSATSH
jgi:uncharacterized protein (TIGR03000 family)